MNNQEITKLVEKLTDDELWKVIQLMREMVRENIEKTNI